MCSGYTVYGVGGQGAEEPTSILARKISISGGKRQVEYNRVTIKVCEIQVTRQKMEKG